MGLGVVGLTRHGATERGGSLATLFATLQAAVERCRRTVLLPADYGLLSFERKRELAERLVCVSDLVVAPIGRSVSDLLAVFEARRRLRPALPIVYLPLGEFPRGARFFRTYREYFTSGDRIAFSSTADRVVFRTLTASCPAAECLLPFGVDTRLFHPLGERRRRGVRRRLGLAEGDVVFIYAGRITAEKNVHSLLRVFREVAGRRGDVRLLVVGEVADVRFHEWGTGPYNLKRSFSRLMRNGSGWRRRVSFLPRLPRTVLAEVLGAADVFVNFSLHHDENFGFGNVEAAACGLPVVCSDWGGFKDTVLHGRTGYRADTLLTHRGVRLDVMQAVEFCSVLAAGAELRQELGARGRERACAGVGLEGFRRRVEAMIGDALRGTPHSGGTHQLTPFGRRFDRTFSLPLDGAPLFPERVGAMPRFSDANYGDYAGLIAGYCSGPADARVEAHAQHFLCSPYVHARGETIRVCDPLWPGRFPGATPAECAIVRFLRLRPFANGEEICAQAGVDAGQARRALKHLLHEGVVLKSRGAHYQGASASERTDCT